MSPEQYQRFIAAAVISMALTPFLIAVGPHLADRLAASARWSRWLRIGDEESPPPEHLKDHVVIAGYGFNGRNVAAALKDLDIPYIVLEQNPEAVRKRRREGESIIYGDCTRSAVLQHAGIERARVYVVAISDPASTRRTVQMARQLHPGLRVIVRTRYRHEMRELRRLGANHTIPEEFETSVEVLARVLRELEVSDSMVRRLATKIRADHYETFGDPEANRVPLRLPEQVMAGADMEAVPIDAGSPAVGKTIGDLRLRSRTGASVIAVRRGKELLTNPGPECVFQAGDVAVLLGTREQVAVAAVYLHHQDGHAT